jgi:threonine/homoserine/homoserine lactone efflux protein
VNPATYEAFAIASAGILSFGQMTLVLVLLSAEGGLRKALAYAAGMGGVLLAVGQGSLLLGSRLHRQPASDGAGAVAWISVVLGVVLLTVALRTWRKPAGTEGERPGFLRSLDSATPRRLLGVGALVGGLNVKNLAIYLSAVDVVVRARVPPAEGMLAVLAVTGIFCLCLLGPIGVFVVGGAWARPALAAFRRALERHSRPLAIGVLTLFGLAFLARGLRLIVG